MSNIDDLLKELSDDGPDEHVDIPTPIETINVEVKQEVPAIIEDVKPIVDLASHVKKIEDVTDSVLKACQQDRSEIQEVVDLMFSEIRTDQEAGRIPSRGYTDNLTKLLEVKSNVNMIAVKMMETNVKMLAATKANAINVTNNNMNVAATNDDLKRLLAEPMAETDEY